MTKSIPSLAARLAPYPQLRRALVDAWVHQHEAIDPSEEEHPIARWLRSNSADYLPVLEQILGIL